MQVRYKIKAGYHIFFKHPTPQVGDKGRSNRKWTNPRWRLVEILIAKLYQIAKKLQRLYLCFGLYLSNGTIVAIIYNQTWKIQDGGLQT